MAAILSQPQCINTPIAGGYFIGLSGILMDQQQWVKIILWKKDCNFVVCASWRTSFIRLLYTWDRHLKGVAADSS